MNEFDLYGRVRGRVRERVREVWMGDGWLATNQMGRARQVPGIGCLLVAYSIYLAFLPV